MKRLADRLVHRGDEGSALIIALAFVTIFSIFLAVILTFTDTSFRTTIAVRSQGAAALAADGAVDGAINFIRSDTSKGRDPALTGGTNNCPDFTTTINDENVTVSCQGTPDSGAPAGGGASALNVPEYAILALGSSGSENELSQGGPETATIGGPIFTNGNVEVDNTGGFMDVDGAATAEACNRPANILTTGTKDCSSSATEDDPGVGNAGYNPIVTSPPAAGTVPACVAGGTVTVDSGSFTGSAATSLETLINTCNATFHFTPGAYYFEFPSANLVWNINNANATIVGGTLGTTPGTCDEAQSGVQFIFDGETQWRIQAGIVRLCAPPSATQQQIAIYGPKPTTPIAVNDIAATTVASAGSFSTPNGGLLSDAGVATDQIDTLSSATHPSTASMSLTGFTNSIPAGATITAATVRVAHSASVLSGSHSNSLNHLTLNLTATPPTGSAQTVSLGAPCTTACEASATLTNLTSVSQVDGLVIAYQASIAGNNGNNRGANINLDSIVLDVTYTTPSLTGQSGCVTTIGGCAFIDADGSNTTVEIKGTVYTPLAYLRIAMPNQNTSVFNRGVIARGLHLQLPSSTSGESHISLPTTGPATPGNRTVLFTAKIVEEGAEEVRLRALVEFDDTSATHAPTIRSWSVVR